MSPSSGQLLAQAGSLLATLFTCCLAVAVDLPARLLRLFLRPWSRSSPNSDCGVQFYEGTVIHSRRAPIRNSFKYPVRVALIDLDSPPLWFSAQAGDHLSAKEAREFAGTTGPVRLLTNPISAGYLQNPISVYYCYESADSTTGLKLCIAEVTNTPWGDRVRFVFDPAGEDVPKSLHVSPFMDMSASWHLISTPPAATLTLTVLARAHPQFGDFFDAHLVVKRVSGPAGGLRNEEASLGTLLRYGYMPQRTAVLIYWQAVKLLFKGAKFFSPPPKTMRKRLMSRGESGVKHAVNGFDGCPFQWSDATTYPWKTD
mmetsp:Transcript_18057/g.32154  ORF Transcript_18057/g.32154 Transcript_18057/m.32154 type:complete len:314 (-) Transcript_18057:162-1103(-)